MFGVLPDRIATDQLLATGGRLQGQIALGRLRRLTESLEIAPTASDIATADLELLPDPQANGRLQGMIQAGLCLLCERCGKPMTWPVSTTVAFYLVGSEAAAASLPDDADYVVAADSLNVLELIEEELLLALPLVARHPAGTPCGDNARSGRVAESGERSSPFDVLKKLKT